MDNHLFSVTIGGIGVTMVCQQKDLCTRLENRYLAFKASDEFSQQMVIH